MNTDDIKLFHKIVDTGSLVDTAELLQQPKSTLSRRIKAMESELSIKLFHRDNRSLILTAAGERFYQSTQKIIIDYNRAIIEITDHTTDITGKIRIQMFPMQANNSLVQLIFAFMAENPNIKVDIITSSEPQDINSNHFDVAFWVEAIFEHLDMVSRPVAFADMYYFASPCYLQRHGTPTHLSELKQHQCILLYFNTDEPPELFPIDNNKANDMKVTGPLCTNDINIAKQAAINGEGITILPIDWCRDELKNKQLVQLFESKPILRTPVNLVYPSRRFVSIAAQRFIDFVMDYIEEHGDLDMINAK